jgi:L-lysine 2,3-aminomutase
MLQHFQNIQTTTIPNLIEEKTQLKDQITTLKDHQIDEYMDICDKIKQIQQQIRSLKQEKKQYLLENSKFIFHYFEQKQQISNSETQMAKPASSAINSFFKIKASTEEAANPQSEKYSQSKKLYQQYWRNVNGEIGTIQDFICPSDICEYCRRGEMIPQEDEGILICNNTDCGKFITYIIDSSKPTN